MSGVKDYNFPLFFEVESALRAHGFRVQNPAKNNGFTLEAAIADASTTPRAWADYMRLDLVRLAKADVICLLDGWINSRGARLELHVAQELGMEVWYWQYGKPWRDPSYAGVGAEAVA